MELRSVISLAVCKRLVGVDLPRRGSNQHEINGVADLREFFSGATRDEPIEWRYFADARDPESGSGTVTFYDARAKSADRTARSEWRLYYSGNFLSRANPGDVLFLARKVSGELFGLVFQEASGWLHAAQRLFNIDEVTRRPRFLGDDNLGREIEFAHQQILDELGIEIELPITSTIVDVAVKELEVARSQGLEFPTTRRMAELAQKHATYEMDRPDEALLALLSTEEQLFRAAESVLVTKRLGMGFETPDEFIQYSLSVQNRRKARMGHALQNHLEFLFRFHRLKFDTQAKTEGKNKPDFLFPGARAYRDLSFNARRLQMLAAKSSCKERWRQILSEANRIRVKHLCTLEQAISADQTREMCTQNVVLVIPAALHSTYDDEQRSELLTIGNFIDIVRKAQQAQ